MVEKSRERIGWKRKRREGSSCVEEERAEKERNLLIICNAIYYVEGWIS